ncbi:MAG: NUDIX domain-containing protein [Candidatus Eisenbacteria bacterium]|uniref:8-oxo-dGTP diphosphatase n=1 Tax=Eiseniibacteriota bacterium TaxID=2212470 RepID=A0A933SHD4_UNCEI|nr:NUDIX domain-containing protein [Candidatus Eisenbacteria bacterium]
MSEAPVRKRVRVVAAVVFDGPRLLMTQRPPGGPLGLQWEFPGGKLEPGEAPEAALVREVREELGVGSVAHDTLAVHEFDYAHGVHVELYFVRCTLDSHAFTPAHAVHAWRWVEPRDVNLSEVLEGDRDFLRSLGATD